MFPCPKHESFQPPKPNGSRGTGTPMFTPHMPASTRSITRRATSPLEVYTLDALPYGFAFSISIAVSRFGTRTMLMTGPKISSRAHAISGVQWSMIVGPIQ